MWENGCEYHRETLREERMDIKEVTVFTKMKKEGIF